MKEKLAKLLGEPVTNIQKLFGEASYRVYHRLSMQSGKTFVLMEMPKGKKMSLSEEITNLKEPPRELPYIQVQRYLKSIGLPVPEIKFFREEEGWLILEDLGDTKLEDIVSKAKPNELANWYKKAINLLMELQTKTSSDLRTYALTHLRTSCVAFARSFDATLFNWEFEHFWEYFFKIKNQKSKIKNEEGEIFHKHTKRITEELCQLPQGFTHRDYQSRNLMIHNNQLYLIDFQDALMGPKVYDVVCLLRDSYVDITPQLEELLGYYCEKTKADLKKFQRIFDLQTVQRKLKDAGRFVYIKHVKGNSNFLKHIPTSLDYVRQALERLSEYKELFELLELLDCFAAGGGSQ